VRGFPQLPQGDVDNRTAIRPRAGQRRDGDRTGETAVAGSLRGPAYLAQQARTALGVGAGAPASGASAAPLTVPAGLIGVAVAAVAVLARPEAVGPPATMACTVALGAVLALALRHSGATALALAVLLALVSVLGAGDNRSVGAAAVAIAAAVLAAAPHLGAVRAGDPRHRAVRLARELTGIGAVAAVLLVAMAPATPLGARVALVTAVALLAGWDAVRGDGATRRRALPAVSAMSAVMVPAALAAGAGARAQTAGAAALLVLWYGLRGLCGHAATSELRRHLVIEYGTFVLVAAAALGVSAGR